jgi:hypothetical protein
VVRIDEGKNAGGQNQLPAMPRLRSHTASARPRATQWKETGFAEVDDLISRSLHHVSLVDCGDFIAHWLGLGRVGCYSTLRGRLFSNTNNSWRSQYLKPENQAGEGRSWGRRLFKFACRRTKWPTWTIGFRIKRRNIPGLKRLGA